MGFQYVRTYKYKMVHDYVHSILRLNRTRPDKGLCIFGLRTL